MCDEVVAAVGRVVGEQPTTWWARDRQTERQYDTTRIRARYMREGSRQLGGQLLFNLNKGGGGGGVLDDVCGVLTGVVVLHAVGGLQPQEVDGPL